MTERIVAALFVGWASGVIMMLIHRDIYGPWRIEKSKKAWVEWEAKFHNHCPAPPQQKEKM